MIRDSQGKLAITPGEWNVLIDNVGASVNYGYRKICWKQAHPLSLCDKADAALIAEAGTVTNTTGRTPAELLKERDEWEAEATRLHGELESLQAEVRQARRQWIGDDAGHLPLAEAIEFVRDREAAELLKERGEARQQMDEWRRNCLRIRERSEAQKEENERLTALVRELRVEIEMYIICFELKYLTRALKKSEGV
jgi:hypothetical protein